MSPVEVLRHPDPEALAESAAARLITTVVEAQASAGWASLCLTGGRIGTAVLASLAENPGCDAIDWSRIDLWWGDERTGSFPERRGATTLRARLRGWLYVLLC